MFALASNNTRSTMAAQTPISKAGRNINTLPGECSCLDRNAGDRDCSLPVVVNNILQGLGGGNATKGLSGEPLVHSPGEASDRQGRRRRGKSAPDDCWNKSIAPESADAPHQRPRVECNRARHRSKPIPGIASIHLKAEPTLGYAHRELRCVPSLALSARSMHGLLTANPLAGVKNKRTLIWIS
jgi:hypothetical protein